MAGIIQQLDIAINQASVNRATQEAQVAGGRIGQALGTTTKAVDPMAAAMSRASGTIGTLGSSSSKAIPHLAGIRGSLLSLASSATSVPGPLGRITSVLLGFAGTGPGLLIAAGIAGIAIAWDRLTEATRKTRDEATKFFEQLRKDNAAALPEFSQLTAKITETRRQAAVLRAEFAGIEKGIGAAREIFGGKLTNRQKEILDLLREEEVALRRYYEEAGVTEPAKVEQRGLGFLEDVGKQAKQDAEEADRKRKADATRWAQFWSDAVTESSGDMKRFTDGAGQAINQMTDDMSARYQELWKKQNTARLTDQSLMTDAERKELEALERIRKAHEDLAAIQKRYREAQQQAADDQLHLLQQQNDAIGSFAKVLLDVGDGLGIISDSEASALDGIVAMVSSTRELLKVVDMAGKGFASWKDVLSGVAGVVSVGIGLIGGLFHKNKNPDRMQANAQWFEAAMQGDASALDRLFAMSGHKSSAEGWATDAAKADAWAKYQTAKAAQDAAAAPGIADKAKQDAAQAERDRLAGIQTSEEGQVTARTEAERKQHIAGLLAGGGPADLAAKLDQLEKEFERLVAQSPLGADSPLARDAQRRADDAARDLENAIAAAKQAAGTAQGKDITPGYTVTRALTESSAGRVIGELTTSNVWLEKIYGALAGVGPNGGGGGGVWHIEVVSVLDGKELGRSVSEYQASSFQHQAMLNGNASMP